VSDTERKIQLFGTRGSADAYVIRDFLHRCDQPFDWIELNNDQQAHTEAQVTGLGDKRLPICVFPDGVSLEHPTVRQISEKLGLFRSPSQTEYDLEIYGAGTGMKFAL
jgi:thioredoxin reductase (NADPH)